MRRATGPASRRAWVAVLLLLAGASGPSLARGGSRSKRAAKRPGPAKVELRAPEDLARLAEGPIAVEVAVVSASGLLPQLIVDNEPALPMPGLEARLRGLKPGPHVLRAVLLRGAETGHAEVVKDPGAFSLVRVWVGPRPEDERRARALEKAAWPDPKRPLLTYVLPLRQQTAGLTLVAAADADAPGGEDGPQGEGPLDRDLPPALPAQSQPLRLDFYLSGGSLGRKGLKIRQVLDRKELLLATEWKPIVLPRLNAGEHHLSIDLLDRRARKLPNVWNRTDATFLVPTAAARQ